MSNVLIYIKVPLYEREWCEYHFGKPVVFPQSAHLNNVIRHFSKTRPKGMEPETQQEGEMAVVLMGSASKKPQLYNYISPSGKEAIAKAVDDLFCMHLWEDLTDIGCREVAVTKLIEDWMDSNSISRDNFHNLRMKFQRLKDAYRKAGVNVSRRYKHN